MTSSNPYDRVTQRSRGPDPYDPSSTQTDLSPQRSLPLPGPSSLAMHRPDSSHSASHIPPLQLPTTGPYAPTYGSDSPSSITMAMHGGIQAGSLMPHSVSPSSLAAAGLQAQKRVYRQRRKDPSCDACRERKVKCDATDSLSCSECTSRNVKCQFTKETNRRMSSIKQVQDLERQLVQTKQQLSHLRATLKDTSIDSDTDLTSVSLEFPDFGSNPQRRPHLPSTQVLSSFQGNMRTFCKGLFKPPAPYRSSVDASLSSQNYPSLPPKPLVDHILDQFYTHIHLIFPILHWPTFKQECEAIYNVGTLQGVPSSWGSLLFAVLACGILHTRDDQIDALARGKDLIEASRRLNEPWIDEYTLNHARVSLLTSMFLFELDVRSAAWTWHGTSVRIAQDIGLHCDNGPWPAVEAETRRRVWWAIYTWDRLLSLEFSRPVLIDDDDCNTDLPQAFDDRHIQEQDTPTSAGGAQASTVHLAMIHVLRFVSPLRQILKTPVISTSVLRTFDTNFSTCLSVFPTECQIASDSSYLDPRYLSGLSALHNTRIILHRHNLTPLAVAEVRRVALDNCILAAKDSAKLLRRSMQNPPGAHSPEMRTRWAYEFATAATSLLCAHIWRSALILSFAAHYADALTCLKALATIGDQFPVNAACGRNLALFLRILVEKIRRGEGGQLERDEEMMAYVSGDLQASPESSWVWQGSRPQSSDSPPAREDRFAARGAEGGEDEWDDWKQLRDVLEELLRDQQQASAGGAAVQPAVSAASKPSNRISIANII